MIEACNNLIQYQISERFKFRNTIQSKVGEILLMITIKYDLEIGRYICQRRVILVALFKKTACLLSPPTTTLQAAATMNDWLIYNFADIGRHIFGL